MKKILLFSFICVLALSLSSQNISMKYGNPDKTVSYGSTGFKIKDSITNNTNAVMQLRWLRTQNTLPGAGTSGEWASGICDIDYCSQASISKKDFTLDAGETGEMAPSITLKDFTSTDPLVSGTGIVVLHIYDLNDSANTNVTVTYTGTVENDPTNVSDFSKSKIRLYPNPAINYFMIEDDNNNVQTINLYNVVGSKIKVFNNIVEGQVFDIENLPKGMYLAQLIGKDGDVIKTSRIDKK